MKYIKTFEKNLKPEEKEGNKVARQIQRLINRLLGISKNIENIEVNYSIFWSNHKYNFSPYLFIKMKNNIQIKWKDIPKIQILIDELIRLGCEAAPPEKWQKPYEDRDNRIFILTQQQVEELLISFKNGLPVKIFLIDKDKIYTFKKLKYKDYIQDKDIVIGKLKFLLDKDIKLIGYDITNNGEEKTIGVKSLWNDDMKYVRESTPEEIEHYNMMLDSKKYNL